MSWPGRGVYFFRENSELRFETGNDPRIVRVGTHALKAGSGTKLWTRLSQHRGQLRTGGGNHRGSIFRLIVGAALIRRDRLSFPTWGIGTTADKNTRQGEVALEREVSQVIGAMTLIWVPIEDDAGPQSRRGFIERNAIALLSNYNKPPFDPSSLVDYNNEHNGNYLGLCPAYQLYENKAYEHLFGRFGATKTYILSAGWGLIRADFLTPHYDITFSPSADDYKRRKKSDRYDDFRMLPEDADDEIMFFGGKDYVPLFCALQTGTKDGKWSFIIRMYRQKRTPAYSNAMRQQHGQIGITNALAPS
jgi:hypothetical protein